MEEKCLSLCFVVAVLPIRTLNTLPTTASDIQCRGHGRKYKTVDSDGRLVCKNCSKCPPGQGVSVECTEHADTVCEPCVAGETFSGTSSSWRRCEQCSVCATHELTKRECTPTKNRKCGICVIGYFYDDITGDCDRCSWCFPEYPNIADRQDECDVTGVKPGFQCGPIIDPPYPPPLDNMEQSTLAKGESTTTKFLPQRTTQSNSKPSKDREKRTSEVYQTSSEFHFVSSRTSPTKWPPPNDTRTTTSAYDRAVLTVQQPIFIATSVNASADFSTGQYSGQSPVPPTALGVVLAVIVATVLGIFCLYVKRDSKRYERERVIHVHMQEPLMEQDTSQEVEIVEISTRTETENSLSAELTIVV
ncbi:uncharacterized protein [Branchiostoma lanceolatum]|uniref:uncharacterized protein n=1 Tax=Branchiostoma lanceolatum TaxID=7740 RepID=UPI0034514DB2